MLFNFVQGTDLPAVVEQALAVRLAVYMLLLQSCY